MWLEESLSFLVGVVPHVREAFEVLFPALHRRAQARRVEDITADLVYGIGQDGPGRIAHHGRDVVSPLDGLGDDEAAKATGGPATSSLIPPSYCRAG